MSHVLVTNGNIGSHVAELLATRGESVRVMVQERTTNPRWAELGIEQITADMGNPASMAPAFAGIAKFFSVTPFAENLVELGRNAVRAAQQAGIRHIVRSSAHGAGLTDVTLCRWHGEVEQAVEGSGIPFTILRPNTFMQSYLMHAQSIATDNTFYLPQGDGRVSVVDVRDIAAVAVACLTEPGHTGQRYTVTGPEALSNEDIAGKFSTLLGRKITYTDVTPEQMQRSMANLGVPAWMTDALLELFAICKAGLASDISSTVAQMARKQPTTFDAFLHDNTASFH